MKKLYSMIGVVALCLSSSAQNNSILAPSAKQEYIRKSPKMTNHAVKITGGVVQGRFDVGFSLVTANGVLPSEIDAGSAGTKVGIYVSPTFCDSTVKSSFSSGDNYMSYMKFGTTFDPKSVIYDQMNFQPLFAPGDSYTLDTLWIGGVYKRKTTDTDTLLIEVVWGDTTTSSVFGRWSYASPYTYYGTWVTPKYTTSNTQQGDKARLSAPLTNKLIIKRALTDADTTFLKTNDYLPIVINGGTGQLIPANNIVSANVTYVPGQASYAVGTIAYNGGTGPSPQTMNGFCAIVYDQNSPAQPVAGGDYFDDFAKGKNYSQYMSKKQRYGTESSSSIFYTTMRGAIATSFWIDFSIHGTSSVGIKEYEAKNFELGQNMPNPYTKESVVRYNLMKDAKSVKFIVRDITGRIMTQSEEANTVGVHSVHVGSYAAGVYYYSLEVDGATTTKKMIVE